MRIHVEALTFDVIIGLLDFEREKAQQVIIDLEATYLYKDANFINYADIVHLVETHLHQMRYELLEEALLGLKRVLKSTYPALTSLSIKIQKPDILSHCDVGLSEIWDF